MLRESSERITLKEWLVIPVKAEKTIKSALKIRWKTLKNLKIL